MIRRSFHGRTFDGRAALCLLGGAMLAIGLTGCGGHDDNPSSGSQIPAPAENQFDRAIELIEQAEDYDLEPARREAVNLLNRWVENEEPDDGWLADPLIGRLPPELRNTVLFRELDAMQFSMPDAVFLQQATWLRDLANWVVEGGAEGHPLDPLSQRRWEETRTADGAALSEEDAEQLAQALRLFDWTVRNIQLDRAATPINYPTETAAAGSPPAGDAASDAAASNAPFRGVAGPGYTLFPWQVMQYGHGDAWQRASVFLLLCHQSGIDAVLLGIENPSPAPVRPWLAATLIGGQLYLFDTSLGLALPGPDGKAVATLAQVVKDPNLLRALDYEEMGPEGQAAKFDYPVTAEDLTRVVALVNAPLEYLTQRMRLLELKLAGDKKMALTMTPSLLGQKLKTIPEVQSVALWNVPYEAFIYRLALVQQGQSNPAAMADRFKEDRLFSFMHPLVSGRRLHLRGEIDRRAPLDGQSSEAGAAPMEAGAKGHYLYARMTDRQLEAIMQSEEMQQELKLSPAPGEDEAAWQARVANFVGLMRQTRPYASYWMGLAHYENRNFDTAATWLSNQVLSEAAEDQWHDGARYNLGRAQESLGRTEKAIAAYREDASPQRHGNLLRAKWLEAAAGP